MEDSQALQVIIAVIILVGMAIGLAIEVFFILTLQKALNRCSIENRAMSPGLLWLLLIPLFNLVWNFYVVINLSESLHKEFQKRGILAEPYPGKSIGMAFSILSACSLIPLINMFTGIASLVCWIIYWMKIAGYSKQLAGEVALQPA